MARVPLLRACRRLLRTAVWLETERTETPAGLSRLEERAFERRKLLQAGALAGASVLARGLVGCTSPAPPVAPTASGAGQRTSASLAGRRIVIVGAGLAGLSAAWRLGEKGFQPDIYEASHRVGGRAYTLRGHFASKAEYGGELIDTGMTKMRTLVPQLGLHLFDLAAAAANLEPARYVFGQRRYSEAELIETFRPVAAQIVKDRSTLGGNATFANFDRTSDALRGLDRMSLEEWLDKHQVRDPARALIDAAYAAEFGLDIGDQSYVNLLLMTGTGTDPVSIYGESDWRFAVVEGSDAIATEIEKRVPTPVKHGHVFEALRVRSDGSLLVSFRVEGRSVDVVADRLAITIPFTVLRRCQLDLALPAIQREAIDKLQYGQHAKVLVGTANRPWRLDKTSGTSFHDAVFHASWDSALPGEEGVLTCLSGGRIAAQTTAGTTAHQGERTVAEASRLFPNLREVYRGRAARIHWPSMPFSLGSYASYAPGQYTGIGGHEGEAFGNVHFAGEHTSKQYQGWLVGAIDSGERVAGEIASALGG
jgi:monoamine oxidase